MKLETPPYIYTASGNKFMFADPDPKAITIADVAHQLANTNRWSGCTRVPFSVAQHSCIVAEMVEGTTLKRLALMHDATEAYVVDMPRPLKNLIPEYREFEAIAWDAICKRFHLPEGPLPKEIKEADSLLLAWEAETLMPPICHQELFIQFPSYPDKIGKLLVPWHWKTARSTFVAYYNRLFE